jgi:predicted phosphohydrolase
MKIFAAADLHVSEESRPRLEQMGQMAKGSGADVLVIAGDLISGPVSQHAEILKAFSGFRGPKLFVAGNHDLWQGNAQRDTWGRYESELSQAVAEAGFHYLDEAPFVHDRWGFVGCMGWYDYSLRQETVPDPDLRFSPATVASPASAFRLNPQRRDLRWHELTPDDYATKAMQSADDNMAQGLVWNDGFYVDWGRSDEEMVDYFCDKLRAQAKKIAADVDQIVAVTHFIPFAEVLPPPASIVRIAYARAFGGSKRLGDTIRSLPNVRAALFGHWHHQQTWQLDGLLAANCSVNHAQDPPLMVGLV